MGFPVENKGKGEGGGKGGGGIGTGRGTGKSMRKLCRNYPLAIYPVVSPLKSTPDPDTSEKCHDAPPIPMAILLQKYALPLAESGIQSFSKSLHA